MVPNGVGTGSPPAKLARPRTVWQSLQLPIAASSRPRLTSAGSNEPGAGCSMAAIAGSHCGHQNNADDACDHARSGRHLRCEPCMIVERLGVLSTYRGPTRCNKDADHRVLTSASKPCVLTALRSANRAGSRIGIIMT